MPVYKDKRRNTWYAKCNYTDALGNHKSARSRDFESKKEAQDELAKMTLEHKQSQTTKTFDDIHREYVEEQKKIVKPITASHYDPLYKHIKDLIGNIKVSKLTIPQYKAIKAQLDETELSTSRKNRIHKHICTLCKYAAANYGIYNSSPQVVGGFYDPTKIEDDKIKFISEEEFNSFIEEFKDDVLFKALFTVLFYQGLRIGEALALNYSDIDFKENKLRINKTYTAKINKAYKDKEYYITSPKTKNSNRTIPLEKHALECLKMLQNHYKEFDKYSDKWFVFGGPYPLSETTIAAKKDNAFSNLDDVERITIHQFRHSCASYLFAHGADPVSVQHFLGHSKLSTTMDIYVHLKNEKLDNIFNF